jgi:hypothetical protein
VYKYDSKNRPSGPVLSAATVSSAPPAVPIMLVNADLQDPAVQYPPDSEGTAPVPPPPLVSPVAHNSPVPDAEPKNLPNSQVSAIENAGKDIFWYIENGKSRCIRQV